ncbi:hypothetical protein LCGC14_1609580 [marine sediment metagenome]|uniref:GIY-YIG domain-containing protein n=1 Tax=marine sediment metagenome TaxID=412755 RepID=A0A0F9KPJ9_9ZZZZ
MPWTIYCHIHNITGRRYVGLTSQTWQERWKNQVHVAKSSKGGRWHFPNAIRKYGKDAFSHKVLGVCDTLEEANIAEIRWIEHFDTRNPEKGFNLAKGGKHVPHPIRKNPWNNPKYRAKFSKLTNAQVREIRVLYASGQIGMRRLARQFGVIRQVIQRAVKNRTHVNA